MSRVSAPTSAELGITKQRGESLREGCKVPGRNQAGMVAPERFVDARDSKSDDRKSHREPFDYRTGKALRERGTGEDVGGMEQARNVGSMAETEDGGVEIERSNGGVDRRRRRSGGTGEEH